MRIVTAIDSFKGSLSSLQAGEAVREAALKLNAANEVIVRPLADGGEGTVDALIAGLGGECVEITVTGPMHTPVNAKYGILHDGTAIMEMSAAAGITLVAHDERDPMIATTYGVGEMIADAIKRGCRRFLIGIGGSATNDGGVGMLTALGVKFCDNSGNPIRLGGRGLGDLVSISLDGLIPELQECTFRIACDVNNPLCGESGCSAVYGPQKGATDEMVQQMDGWLHNYARFTASILPASDAEYPGVGAAGGMGFAFKSFLNAQLQSGIQIVLEETELEKYIAAADLIVTGEGRMDAQTVMGKAPIGVAKLAKKHGKPVVAFSGCITPDADVCNAHGIDAFFSIVPGVVTLEEALNPENAYKNLVRTAEQALRLLTLGSENNFHNT